MWPFKKKIKNQTLHEALESLLVNANKYNWNKNSYAKSGNRTASWYSKEANSFCIVGLVYKTTVKDAKTMQVDEALSQSMQKSLKEAVNSMGYTGVNLFRYNDTIAESKQDILKLIKKAIELEAGR